MIIIDAHEPSDLKPLLNRLGCDVVIDSLEYGDAAWDGNGPDGPVMVGVERKYITDLVDSMISRRLPGHQLPGMRETYHVRYLLVEGLWRPSPSGDYIEVANYRHEWVPLYHERSSVSYQQVDSFLDEVTEAGITVIRSARLEETAAIYRSRYRHWQKPYSDHRSMKLIYTPELPQPNVGKAAFRFRKPTFINKVGSLLPGVDMKAWDLDAAFYGRPREMAMANFDTWKRALGIKGKKSITVEKIIATWEGKVVS